MRMMYWSLAAALLAGGACSSSDGSKERGDGSQQGDSGGPPAADAGPDASPGGGSGGAMDGSLGNGSPDGGHDGVCEEVAIGAKPTIPDMLIVLDRSTSMKTSAVNRWDPSVSALKSVTAQLDSTIRFGLMMFPQPCGNSESIDDIACRKAEAYDDHCKTGTLKVPVASRASSSVATQLDAASPGGGTPTGSTLEAALKVLAETAPIDPKAPRAPQNVMLVTDGQPSCPEGKGLASATPEQLASDLALAVKSIDALKNAGIKTYVIGYTEMLDDRLKNALTELATHGGTTNYHTVQDEAGLVTEFKKIAGAVVPCSYQLAAKPDDLSYVQVKLDGKQLNLNDPNGWSISEKTVTVQGAACKSLQDGQSHQLSVKVLCTVVPPI